MSAYIVSVGGRAPRIDAAAWVAPGAGVVGAVTVGRALSDRELDAARRNAAAYVGLARTHRQALTAEAAQ